MSESHKSYTTLFERNNPSDSSKFASKEHVFAEPMFQDNPLPQLIRPASTDVSLLDWAKANTDFVDAQLKQFGALLFRGFKVSSVEMFQKFAEICSLDGLVEYSYFRSSPRTKVSGNVYTSTEYPADRSIPPHNEMSYTRTWPKKIWFYCAKPAAQGGATPIADSAKVFQRISPQVREKFMKYGVMYIRNYHEGIDLPYQEVFGTDNRIEIEQFCREQGIECEFGSKGKLRTKQKCQAVFVHPETGQTLWFNQAHLFHSSRLDPRHLKSLLALYGQDGLPRNCCYGDGSPIDQADLDSVRDAYRQESVAFPWMEGDIMMLDNVRVAHGRDPFSGERKVFVAMADKFELDAAKS
jgi:alpha-ketoglutarate-dependent taurine dioxygenase